MANGKRTTLPIAEVFSRLFHNFHRLLLTNLIFAVPFAAFFGIFYAINELFGIHSNFILLLTAIPLFPFYAGVVQVTAHIANGEERIAVFSDFIAAVKDNFLRFLVHGVVFYLAVVFSYWSIPFYLNLAVSVSGVFFAMLVVSIIVSVFMLFAFFYIPSMTVTFDIPMKDIYKNSVLMAFGEFKHNLIAVFGLFLLFVICSSALICCGGVAAAILIVTAVLALFIVPSIAAFIINSAIYKRMYIMIIDTTAQKSEIDKKIDAKRGEIKERKKQTPQPELDEELKKLELDENGDGDEYIYFNGRMVKRSVLIKLKQEAKEREMNG